MRNVVPLLFLFATACISPMRVEPISIPLQYQTMAEADEYERVSECAALSDIRVTDARTDKTLGKRFIQGVAEPWADITTDSNVAEWVTSGAVEGLKHSGVGVAIAEKPVLHISIEQVIAKENVFFAGGYEGRVVLSAELSDLKGKSCWQGRAEGTSDNYGYAGSIDNYQETLNHALDRAVISLLSSLESDVCECGQEDEDGPASERRPVSIGRYY